MTKKKEVKIFSSKVHSYVSFLLLLAYFPSEKFWSATKSKATQGFLENKKGLSFRACHSKETELEQSYKRLFHNLGKGMEPFYQIIQGDLFNNFSKVK